MVGRWKRLHHPYLVDGLASAGWCNYSWPALTMQPSRLLRGFLFKGVLMKKSKRTNKRTTADTNIGGGLILFFLFVCVVCVLAGLGALGAVL